VRDVFGADFKGDAKGIEFGVWLGGNSLLVLDGGISVSVDGRVDAEGEDVLMRWGHDTRSDHDSVRNIVLDTLLHGYDGHDTSGTSLKVDRTSRIEDPAEDVFVIGDGHDRLDDEFAGTNDFGTSVTEIGVLPTNTSIDFVHANCVLHLDRLTLLIVDPSVKVLDDAEAIASESEIVGGGTGSAFTEIVRRLAMVRRSRIAVRDSHLSESQAVKDGSAVVADISEDGAFAIIKGQAELPLLPGDDFVVFGIDGEADALGLRDVQRFEILSERLLHLSGVFLIGLRDENVIVLGAREELGSKRQSLNADDFLAYSVDDAGEVEGVGIMIEGRMLLIGIDGSEEEVALQLDEQLVRQSTWKRRSSSLMPSLP
jgi:hypothetical protein